MEKKINESKVLITGSTGMLGSSFVEVLRKDYPSADIIPLDHGTLDVTNRDDVLSLLPIKPDIIIHCAANTNADYCEHHPAECELVQVTGTTNIISLASLCGAKVMYPQSFLIFSGGEEFIHFDSKPNPLSEYGRCKLKAERLINDSGIDALIVRMGGFFGGCHKDKNFIGKLTRKVQELIADGISEYAVGIRTWQPTYTVDLAQNTLLLLENGKSGTWSMASEGKATFFELAKAFVSILGLNEKLNIVQANMEDIEAADTAKRPTAALLSNEQLRAAGLCTQRHWETALEEYLTRPWFKTQFSTIQPS